MDFNISFNEDNYGNFLFALEKGSSLKDENVKHLVICSERADWKWGKPFTVILLIRNIHGKL